MIAKRVQGVDMAGLIWYLHGPGRHNEHVNPRVLGASPAVAVPLGRTLSAVEKRDLSDQMDWPHQVHGTEVTAGHVWHLSLTAAAADRALSDDEWWEISNRIMRELGVENPAKAPARWSVHAHGLNEGGSHHVHIAANLIRDDGTRVDIWRDKTRLSESVRQIERDYGLTELSARWKGTGKPGVAFGESERAAREGRSEPERVELERTVREISVVADDEAEFVRRLDQAGLSFYGHRDPAGRVDGYAVGLPAEGRDTLWYAGSSLAKDLSLPRLRRHWTGVGAEVDATDTWAALGVEPPQRDSGTTATATREAPMVHPVTRRRGSRVRRPGAEPATGPGTGGAAGRGGGRREPAAPVPGPETPGGGQEQTTEPPARREELRIGAGEWDEAHRHLAQVVEHLAGIPAGDQATWALAAREAAGVVAAWSRRIETRPGPLARAAEQLARSAQAPVGEPLTRPDMSPVRHLRGVAMVMAQATMRSDSGAAWVLLAAQFLELIEQIEAAHRARDEADQAARLAGETHRELEQLRQEWADATDLREVVPAMVAAEVVQAPPAPSPASPPGSIQRGSPRRRGEPRRVDHDAQAEERRRRDQQDRDGGPER